MISLITLLPFVIEVVIPEAPPLCVYVAKMSFKLQRELPNQFLWPEPLRIQYSIDTGQ